MAQTMQLIMKKLSEIKPYWRNPRKNDQAVDAVMKSIQRYGYNVPIAVDKDGVIILGHTRYKALKKLYGDDAEVPVLLLDLPREKVKEFRIVDNQTHTLSTWDVSLLIAELREIQNLPELQVYFPAMNLESLITGMNVSVSPVYEQGEADPNETQEQQTRYTPHEVSPADITEAEHRVFSVPGPHQEDDLVRIRCPQCGHEFLVSASNILRQAEVPLHRQ